MALAIIVKYEKVVRPYFVMNSEGFYAKWVEDHKEQLNETMYDGKALIGEYELLNNIFTLHKVCNVKRDGSLEKATNDIESVISAFKTNLDVKEGYTYSLEDIIPNFINYEGIRGYVSRVYEYRRKNKCCKISYCNSSINSINSRTIYYCIWNRE